MTSDVDSLQELVQMGLLMFVSNGLLLVVSVVVLAAVSWKLLLLCFICVPFVVLASIRFQRESNAAYLDVRDGIGNTLSQLQEGIAGVRVVQAFGREDVESARFQRGNYRCKLESFPLHVERNGQGADLRCGEDNLQVLDAIAYGQSDAIALAHAKRQQPVCKLVHPPVELAVGYIAKFVLSRGLDGKLMRVSPQAVVY
jgi:ABC-type multidrug transport system fused ATPase/permease subunit